MSILDRTRTSSSHQTSRPFPVQARGLTGTQLREAADASHSIAEQEFDRSLETREALEHAYLAAAQALDGEQHPRRAHAWLGLATVGRYQKGRRDDALAAYDEALAAAPEDRAAHPTGQDRHTLGARHRDNWNVVPEHYLSIAYALTRSVRDVSGLAWSNTLSSSWTALTQWITGHMLDGHHRNALKR